ncbi:PadR family transcriptional regulator [uncultured Acidaminococcus sp.]|uniref:PadR family transcriptional regulator n=1 Tax=uncultured Acidaminococcus sp. TaxID=352152 RepID=UPI002582ADFF|nr:PadR family transcriptional regulator [uncultured Acidaminococcus sp.]
MTKEDTLQYILLGLLAKRDLTGYDMKKLFGQEVRDFWYARHSQVYPELRKLEESGLITSYTSTVGTKLQKKYYRLAATGRQKLRDWLAQPLGDMMPTRDEFTMKLYLMLAAAVPHPGSPRKRIWPRPDPPGSHPAGNPEAGMGKEAVGRDLTKCKFFGETVEYTGFSR